MTSILKVDTIQNSTGTDALSIDSNGYVTQAKLPVFLAVPSTSEITLTTTHSQIVFGTAKINSGNHYNTTTGEFTCPVDGIYEFGITSIGNGTATVYRLRPYKNGASIDDWEWRGVSAGAYTTNGELCIYVECSAGDVISLYGRSDDGTNLYGIQSGFLYVYFRGRLVG